MVFPGRKVNCVKKNNTQEKKLTGLVVAAHGRHYVVELAGGELLQCYPRGKKTTFACGDKVDIERTGDRQGVIKQAHPRTSLLYRSDRYRQKIIAANVSQVMIVVAAQPAFHEDLLMRCLIACEQQHIKATIVLNKTDLVDESAATKRKLVLYQSLGYALISVSATTDISPLRAALRGHRTVMVGQSAMGKSTIVNALVPEAQARTNDFSIALDAGKHTTTSAHLYHLDAQSSIIDSPGMQSFGLNHLSQAELIDCFPEFRPCAGMCRFADCRHTVEPGCAILAAVEKKEIDLRRWTAYRTLTKELKATPPAWA